MFCTNAYFFFFLNVLKSYFTRYNETQIAFVSVGFMVLILQYSKFLKSINELKKRE